MTSTPPDDPLEAAVARIDAATRERAAIEGPPPPGATPVILHPRVVAKEPPTITDPVDGRTIVVDPDRPRTPIGSPGEALTAHLRFLDWLRGPDGAWAADRASNIRGDHKDAGHAFLVAAANMAETIYVSAEMSRVAATLADANGDTIPVIHPTDVPTPAGLVILGDPVHLLPHSENDGAWYDHTVTRALLWATVGADGHVRTPTLDFEVHGTEPDSVNDMDHLFGRGGLLVWELYDAGEMLVAPGAFENNGRPPLLPGVTSAIPWGSALEWHDHTSAPRVRRYLGCLLRLMWQRVAPVETWRPSRQVARQYLRRRKLPLDGEGVKVLHLRRYEVPAGDPDRPGPAGSGTLLDHAITVRGHWRDQWYRSMGPARHPDGTRNEESHRRIWIDSHIRGEGPLVLAHPVTAVVR